MIPSLPCHNLPVYTKSGRYLGRIVEVEVDALARTVVYYHGAPFFVLARLGCKRLLISPNQVISLSKSCMVVEDINPDKVSEVAPKLVSEVS
jgi:hypothetical protein